MASYGCITPWATDTVTGTWTSNTTYTCKSRRVGDSLEYYIRIDLSGAPNAATTLTLNVPGGRTVDESKIVASTFCGPGFAVDAGTGRPPAKLNYDATNDVMLVWAMSTATDNDFVQVTTTVPWTWASGDLLFFWGELPITGW